MQSGKRCQEPFPPPKKVPDTFTASRAARLISQPLSTRLGQPVVVDNRPQADVGPNAKPWYASEGHQRVFANAWRANTHNRRSRLPLGLSASRVSRWISAREVKRMT